jgi:cell division protein FtsB
LSSFALQVGLAIAMVTAAVAAVVVLRRHSSAERVRGEPARRGWWLGDDKHSMEAVEAKAAEAAKVGENVLAAVKPIEFALKDLSKRVGELHARVDVSGKMLAKLSSPSRADEPSPEEKARAAVDAKLEELQPRLKVLSDDLSTLKQAVEGMTARESAIADTVETSLVDVQGQINALILRIERGERSRADLSLVASLANLKASSEEIAQRVAEMERHFPSVPNLETRPVTIAIPVDVQPTEVAGETPEITAPALIDEAIDERADGDPHDAPEEPALKASEPTPWMLRLKERGRLRRRCLVCGQTKLLRPNERMCDDCEQLSEIERSRRRSLRKRKASKGTIPGDLRPRGKRK